jgi:hypothetical protein
MAIALAWFIVCRQFCPLLCRKSAAFPSAAPFPLRLIAGSAGYCIPDVSLCRGQMATGFSPEFPGRLPLAQCELQFNGHCRYYLIGLAFQMFI